MPPEKQDEISIANFEILFVDDEQDVLFLIHEYLSGHGYKVTTVDNGFQAAEIIKAKEFDIVFSDLKMPELNGLELLSLIKEQRPDTEVIIITGHGTIETAVEALKLGSYDYLQKPIELERLRVLINRIVEKKKLLKENILLKKRLKERHKYEQLVGISRRMQQIYKIIDRISHDTPNVLIQGESGTGKEIVANVIHSNSTRKDMPFVPVNCGAIVESLLESELFGHVKGAFTGAIRDKIGLFKAAEGGTIFLDEIAEIAPPVQVKLLRVLQEKKVRPVGGTREIPADVRVIAATNRNIEEAVNTGALRKDLFYRLNVVFITMPPLGERKEDIPVLANHFLDLFNSRSTKRVTGISPKAMDLLINYNWPGNVRQLENAIERAFVLGTSENIDFSDLPVEIVEFGKNLKKEVVTYSLIENEILLIKKALLKTNGNRKKAAKLLGINTTTVYRKIEKYQIDEAN